MSQFGDDLRDLLLQKISNKELDLSEESILKMSVILSEVNGKMRYFIDTPIVEKLSDNVKQEIEKLWNSYE